MSLDVAYSYCINLTEEEKFDIDKQVKKNRFGLKFAIYFPFFPFLMPEVPFNRVEGFVPQQIVRNVKDRAQQVFTEKVAPLFQFADEREEAYNEYKIYSEMSRTLSKVSKKFGRMKRLTKIWTNYKNN
jgi:hypothetical protein